jgi:hypothetical protein
MICAHEGRPEPEYVHPSWDEPGDSLDALDRITARQQWWADYLAARTVLAEVETLTRPKLEW